MKKKLITGLVIIGLLCCLAFSVTTKTNLNPAHKVGDVIDNYQNVAVYYNGGVDTSLGRNLSEDGYNLGIKYQCVEFIKRFYFQFYHHKMPDTYGHAKDFFDHSVADGGINKKRALLQFTNGSISAPETGDIIVFSPTLFNRYGHVAIVSAVEPTSIEIIQQNPGPFSSSRERFELQQTEGIWRVKNQRIYGWLRMLNEGEKK
ncbi:MULTISPECIES: CHAP domain-containing protein [Photorhabdus]|uniref:Trypanothione synthetase domain protein n=2 Tax=Photorhabdus asymbiotica TaxID=291112 RepID=B6VL39_PHOAA|nr:CHAP domain-containing protein [Photorhabdus asymbiotica]RKS57116.1 CHAP domain-containing protein [Photorhabdus asymbiotica]CAQ84529.1 trypanothione synthetase domain protein precursor [Photorhabdus asymbiotica]CAR66869.1 trypanothione synthetase domain protein precursor [Photorhabdus asymbiotica subsp. asymbiotica ATCC 43949]